MTEKTATFRYKLDFYYQSAIIYLLTLVVYGGIRGSVVEARFEYVLNDPIMYVIVFFVLMSFATLGLNMIRSRRLVVSENGLTFSSRFRELHVPFKELEWVHIGREARVQTAGRFQIVILKPRGRRAIRIRVGRYERERELVAEIQRATQEVPKRPRRSWPGNRMMDR